MVSGGYCVFVITPERAKKSNVSEQRIKALLLTLPRFKPWESFYGIPWFCNTPPTNFHLLRSAKGIPTAEAVYIPVAMNSRSCSCHCPYVLSFRMEPLPMSSGISFHTRSATYKPCDCALAAAR